MPAQEKRYIEVSDILSLRCDCKLKSKSKITLKETSEQCGASLSLPLKEDAASFLLTCPKCGGQWVTDVNSDHAKAIRAFEGALAGLKANFNFRLYLELAQPPHLPSDAPPRIG
jgi:hypothetical protein